MFANKFTSELKLPKTKCLQLDQNAQLFILPIKAAHVCLINEQVHVCKKGRTTAIIDQPFYQGQYGLADKKCGVQTLWQIWLDSGSDGDIIPPKTHNNKGLPYAMRAIPQMWRSSHYIFHTENQGETETSSLNIAALKDSKFIQIL